MKVRVSDWAWLPLAEYPQDKLPRLKKRLTRKPKKTSQHQEEDQLVPLKMFRIEDGMIGVPRSFFWQNRNAKHEVVDETSMGRVLPDDVKFDGELWKDQPEALAVLRKSFKDDYGGIIQAKTGWGKTVFCLAAWIATGGNAIVMVDRGFLQRQWVKRIKKWVPNARIGIIQEDQLEYGEDYDISIVMLQTLRSRQDSLPEDLWSDFRLTIVDECELVAAPTIAKVIPRMTSRYRLGVSATPKRKDGMDDVFFDHLGQILYKSKEKMITPALRRVYTGYHLNKMKDFDPNKASKEVQLRFLCKSPDRNNLIVRELLSAVKAGRKIIVLSGKRNHLEWLSEKFNERKPDDCTFDFYVGGRKDEELDKAEKADVIFGTYKMASRALDIVDLDTLFLATPMADVEQTVGRIMRECDDKKQPVVVDFIDSKIKRFKGLWESRARYYRAEGIYNG